MTAEDPVEFNLAGINQVQTKAEIGLTFAAALRSFLRQDPDVIMVGEIRDYETAEIGVKAALTGHLVLSTLHTNDAPSTISRLLNMAWSPSWSRPPRTSSWRSDWPAASANPARRSSRCRPRHW